MRYPIQQPQVLTDRELMRAIVLRVAGEQDNAFAPWHANAPLCVCPWCDVWREVKKRAGYTPEDFHEAAAEGVLP